MPVDLKPSAGMAAAARRGLRLHKAGRSGSGLKPETVANAGKISRRESLSEDHVRKMNGWFARHTVGSRTPGWSTPGKETEGYVAWLLWGGDAGQQWAKAKVAQMEREKKQMKAGSQIVFACGSLEVIEAGEADSPKKFTVRAYNGGQLKVNGWDMPVVIDLPGMEQARSVTANLHHDSQKIVGHVTAVQNDGKSLEMSGVVSGANDATREFLMASGNGFPWQASVEVMPSQVEELPDGKSTVVNGQKQTGPAYIARKSRLYGVAFLPRGADENTSVRLAAAAAVPSPTGETMTFEKWIEGMGFQPESLTDQQRAALLANFESREVEAGGADEVSVAGFDLDEIKAAHDDAVAEYEAAVTEFEGEMEQGEYKKLVAAGARKLREIKATAIREKWAAPKYSVQAIKASTDTKLALHRAVTPRGPSIRVGSHDRRPEVLEAALCMAAGIECGPKTDARGNVVRPARFKDDVLEAADKQYRNISIGQILLMAAADGGMVVRPGERIHMGNIGQVMEHARHSNIHAGNGFSTLGVGVGNLLSNVANKSLLDGYEEGDQTWREIARTVSVRDFKTSTRYRLLDSMAYEKVGPTGEIKHGTVGQESYTHRAATYAKMFSITREDIINDDLGAFDDLRTRLGMGAAQKMNDVFWEEFLDNASFFTSARGNYISGATTNLAADGVGLGLGIKAFRQMVTAAADGAKRLGGNPEILLIPPELEAVAQQLYVASNLVGGSTTVANANIYVNKYRPVVCPWLSDSSVTGYSTTAWYLLRSPVQYPTMVVSFLNGQQAPTVESSEADFSTLGIQFRGYHDFGCDQAEYVGGVKSKGAA